MSNVDLSLPLKGAVVPGSARETPATRRPRSRDRKVEIFISNAACKVSGAPPLQVIFMGPEIKRADIYVLCLYTSCVHRVAANREARIHSDHRFRDRRSR